MRDVLVFTQEQWGTAQMRAYNTRLYAAFTRLAQFPALGNPRSAFGVDIRSHRVGQHVIIYQATDTELLIVRILHVRRDLDAEFA